MAHLQQKELDLIDYKFGERRRDGCPDSQDPQLLDFSEPDYPSCESPGPTAVSSEDGQGQMGHPGGMWPPGLSHKRADRWLPNWAAHSTSRETYLAAVSLGIWYVWIIGGEWRSVSD